MSERKLKPGFTRLMVDGRWLILCTKNLRPEVGIPCFRDEAAPADWFEPEPPEPAWSWTPADAKATWMQDEDF